MSDDPEFDAKIAELRAKIRANRAAEMAEMERLLTERFERRGGPWKPRNLPAVEIPDFKEASANDR